MNNTTKAAQAESTNTLNDLFTQAFDNKQAAAFCGVGDVTMRNSRMTGLLCGIEAPKFRKIGRRVIYLREDLQQWLNDLPAYQNTTESRMASGA